MRAVRCRAPSRSDGIVVACEELFERLEVILLGRGSQSSCGFGGWKKLQRESAVKWIINRVEDCAALEVFVGEYLLQNSDCKIA